MDEFMAPAFFVVDDDSNHNLNTLPADGPSYLLKVRRETAALPDIVVADVHRLPVKKNSTRHIIPEEKADDNTHVPDILKLTYEDQMEHVEIFSEMREKVAWAKIKHPQPDPPQLDTEEEHPVLCFGENADVDGLREGALPLLSTLMSMTQVQILQALDDLIDYLECSPMLSYQRGAWLYALLVFTEIPLTPETCSSLRTLARTCAKIRDTLESVFDPQLPAVNLFICLVSQYFGQKDLADM
ncbi:gem-associated protein 2 isoform X2 [Bacillus rossius redtenbacheri]|uniref:gem-associated protein 2 isoform X2 n=1 Tax=Bacillus rossius redtenbacheri TaxID=93214 RepID=UPI002FDCA698